MDARSEWIAANCRFAQSSPTWGDLDAKYPKAGGMVDGRAVGKNVSNLSSISASLGSDYEQLPGIREVQMSEFGGPRTVFYAADDFRKSKELAARIASSGVVDPLIIAVDREGPYILEGAHRYVALCELKARSFPALIVIDAAPMRPKVAARQFYWPHSRVSAKDYVNYHRQMLAKHMDVPLLRKMIADVTPMVEYVWENSRLRHHPDSGKRCEKCDDWMTYYDSENADPEIVRQLGDDAGYWKCENCSSLKKPTIEGWERTLSKRVDDRGRWMYTDAFESLNKWLTMTESSDPGTANAGFEAIVQFAHMSGPQSNWFIEGGTATVDKVRAMGEMEPPLRAWVNRNCKFAQQIPPEIAGMVRTNPLQALKEVLDFQPELTIQFLKAYQQVYKPREVSFQGCASEQWKTGKCADPVIVISVGGESYVLETGDFPDMKEAQEFVASKYERDLFAYVPYRDFNKEFWEYPEGLYHATDPQNVQSILANGLTADNKTRGLSNRGMGNAVFTSTDPEVISYYGTAVFEIDTQAMKADGYTPEVTMESPLDVENMKSALGHKLGIEYVPAEYGSEGLDERTVAVFGNIPAKYVKLMQ